MSEHATQRLSDAAAIYRHEGRVDEALKLEAILSSLDANRPARVVDLEAAEALAAAVLAPTPPTEEPHDDDLASEPEFGRVSPDTLTLIEGATSHSFSGLSRAFAVTFEDEPDELEALRDRQDILTLAQHCKTYADGDVYLAATRVLHLFRAADPFAAYERVVAERDEAQRARIALKQTIDAFPDANNAANLAHARAERDRLRSDLNQATAARQRLDLLAATFDGTAMWNGSGLYAGLRDILASWRSSPSEGNTTDG